MGRMDESSLVGRTVRVLSIVLVAGGIAVLGLFEGADLWSQWMAEQRIVMLTAAFDNADDAERLGCKRQAELYNARLSGARTTEQVLPYAKQLLYRHETMMGYLEIPKIGVKQPIYHGSAETELMAGVGHLASSALPIGGKGCRCVLLGHAGMRNARMFDDLELLGAGDTFTIWTLNEPYAYRVFSTEVVDPRDVPACIAPEPGRDLVTLVTCTPYGVNSHRLLVHAERCAYKAATQPNPGVRAYVNRRTSPLLAALGLLVVAGAALTVSRMLAVRKLRHNKMMRKEG